MKNLINVQKFLLVRSEIKLLIKNIKKIKIFFLEYFYKTQKIIQSKYFIVISILICEIMIIRWLYIEWQITINIVQNYSWILDIFPK